VQRPVIEVTISNAPDLITFGEELDARIFRGQGNDKWGLSPSIERNADRWKLDFDDRLDRELAIRSLFKKRAHQFLSNPPPADSHLEWTALLQHFGGPTRLLDVTWSYLVATFFAIEQAEGDGIVWAFNTIPLREGHSDDDDDQALCHSGGDESRIRLVEPRRQIDRLSHQQGAFLMGESVDLTFEEQLAFTMNCDMSKVVPHSYQPGSLIFAPEDIIRIRIPQSIHSPMMRFLERSNVSAVTLFHDLAGFARSLNTKLRINDY
jgi:hypothetical protein